jgi:hypothetical protein
MWRCITCNYQVKDSIFLAVWNDGYCPICKENNKLVKFDPLNDEPEIPGDNLEYGISHNGKRCCPEYSCLYLYHKTEKRTTCKSCGADCNKCPGRNEP